MKCFVYVFGIYLGKSIYSFFCYMIEVRNMKEFFFVFFLYCIKCILCNECVDYVKCVGVKKYYCKDFIYLIFIDLKEK